MYLTDDRLEQLLRPNEWNELRVTPSALIGYVNRTADAVTLARRNGVALPPQTRAVVYRPHWLQPVVFRGSAEPYNPHDRSLRARLRPVPPPPA